MAMRKKFNTILDINGRKRRYPIDKNSYSLFFTEDKRFFIYALYTKKDFSSPDLIEIDFDSYMDIRDDETVENVAANFEEVAEIILRTKEKAFIDNLRVSQILKL